MTIILPRQARDRHGKNVEEKGGGVFRRPPAGPKGRQTRRPRPSSCGLRSVITSMSSWRLQAQQVRKRSLLRCHFALKIEYLSRQARDRHRESRGKQTTCAVFLFAGVPLDRYLWHDFPEDSATFDIQVRIRVFLRHVFTKTITLPRQARDQHRENSKTDAFSYRMSSCLAQITSYAKKWTSSPLL